MKFALLVLIATLALAQFAQAAQSLPVVSGTIVALIGFNLAPAARNNFLEDPLLSVITLGAIILTAVLFRGLVGRLAILVGVEVISDGGDEPKVGDLVSEYRIDIVPPVTGLAIEVTGLESCSSPDAGGFCTGN